MNNLLLRYYKQVFIRVQCNSVITTTRPVQTRNFGNYDNSSDEVQDLFAALRDRIQLSDSPDKMKKPNAFKVFGIEDRFNIDKSKLQREMRKLQNSLHPDRFVGKGKADQIMSEHLSAMINDYYHILNHPYKRAKYLLSVITNKSPSEVEDDLDAINMDPDFLSNMMDTRETIDDKSTDKQTLTKLHLQLESELNGLVKGLDKDFSEKNITNIYSKLGKLKFIANCVQSVSNRLESFSNL